MHSSADPLGYVLIIDDDALVLRYQGAVLAAHGFACHMALSASDGMTILSRERVDAVICDFHMPAATGLDFLRQLRAQDRFRRLPTAIVTADLAIEPAAASEAEVLGARLVADMLRREELIALVESLVAKVRGLG